MTRCTPGGQALRHNARMTEQRNVELSAALDRRRAGDHDGARAVLMELATRFPDDAEVAYQAACVHDSLGLEAEAVPYYVTALGSPDLTSADRHGAFLGLGSTYRNLGRYAEAITTLHQGLAEFPGDASLRTFLAITHYNVGQSSAAVGTLLKVLAETSVDAGVVAYRRAIEFYADHLDEVV
jgi:tetratricopeptide (TPR) repeat protein